MEIVKKLRATLTSHAEKTVGNAVLSYGPVLVDPAPPMVSPLDLVVSSIWLCFAGSDSSGKEEKSSEGQAK